MIRATFLSVLPLLLAAAASAQMCSARIEPRPDPKWSSVASSPIGTPGAQLRTMAHLRCIGCKPEVSVLLLAGPASPALQNMPIGRKVGLEWARAVVDDPASREGFRRSVLRSELRSSPGCTLQGAVKGAEMVGNLGAIATAIEAQCSQGTANLSGEFYSAYDYNCEYQVQVVWPGGTLAPAARSDVNMLLSTVHFGL